MLVTLRDISVKVTLEDEVSVVDEPDTKTKLPPAEELGATPSMTVASEEVPDAPSESGSSEAPSGETSLCQSLRQEGSTSEYGETDDEGMVVVGRHH